MRRLKRRGTIASVAPSSTTTLPSLFGALALPRSLFLEAGAGHTNMQMIIVPRDRVIRSDAGLALFLDVSESVEEHLVERPVELRGPIEQLEVQKRKSFRLGPELLAELVVQRGNVIDIERPALEPSTSHIGHVYPASVVQRSLGVDVVNTPELRMLRGSDALALEPLPQIDDRLDLTERHSACSLPPQIVTGVTTIRPRVLGLPSGGGEIRTHGPLAGPTAFKTAPFDRSGTPP